MAYALGRRRRLPCKLLVLAASFTPAGALSAIAARAPAGPCSPHRLLDVRGGPCRDRAAEGGPALKVRDEDGGAGEPDARKVHGRAQRSEGHHRAAWSIWARQANDSSTQQAAVRGQASLLRLWREANGLIDEPEPVEPPEPDKHEETLEQAFTPAEVSESPSQSPYAVAPPGQIALVYVLLFGPLTVLWLSLHRYGAVKKYLSIMLPITLVALLIGFDTANQSLSALARAPNSITAAHAISLWLLMGVWTLAMESRQLAGLDWRLLRFWVPVMVLFMGYQMMNHLVSYFCSLSERIIFLNLCPVVSLVLELLLMPSDRQPKTSVQSKLALLLMALGAVLFTLEKADFTRVGFGVASVFILVLIPYRLAQRWAVTGKCVAYPLGILASLDGFALFLPSAVVARAAPSHSSVPFGEVVHRLFSDGSALFLLFLTMATFIGIHLCGLLMMRNGTATSYIVFSNMANFVLVALSILLFKENVAQSPLMVTGLLLSLLSGIWYSMEVRKKEQEAEAEREKETSKAQEHSRDVANNPGGAAELLARANSG